MQDGIAISVDPNAVNEYIAKQIIDSALGERLKETIEEALKQLGRYGNDPLKSAVTSEVNKHIIKFVQTEFSAQIEERVRTEMTPEFINNLVSGFMSSVIATVDKRY